HRRKHGEYRPSHLAPSPRAPCDPSTTGPRSTSHLTPSAAARSRAAADGTSSRGLTDRGLLLDDAGVAARQDHLRVVVEDHLGRPEPGGHLADLRLVEDQQPAVLDEHG